MPIVTLEGPGDPRLVPFRDVRDPDLLRAHGLFVAEGRRVVERLIGDRQYVVRSLVLNRAALQALKPTLRQISDDVPIYLCGNDDCSAIVGFNIHRGCLALVERPRPTPFVSLLPSARRLVVLEGVTDADNVGGVFRNAAAFGVDAVLLSPTT